MYKEKNAAIVLAAGKGSRMQSDIRKQYMLLQGKPVLYYALKAFEMFDGVDSVILVTDESEITYCEREIAARYGFRKVSKVIAGGGERFESVYKGLLETDGFDYVFIHDGARPFVDLPILNRALQTVREYKACAAGMPIKDTVKVIDEQQFVKVTPDRSCIWIVQTPQVFETCRIREAYRRLMDQGITCVTDDAMVMERMSGNPVKLFEGSYRNIKITTPEDIVMAQALLGECG